MATNIKTSVFALVLLVFFRTGFCETSQQPRVEVQLQVHADHFLEHDPIFVKLTITNKGDESIGVSYLLADSRDVTYEFTDSMGRTNSFRGRENWWLFSGLVEFPGTYWIEKHQVWTDYSVLFFRRGGSGKSGFIVDQKGKFTLRARFKINDEHYVSNSIKIDVHERSEAQKKLITANAKELGEIITTRPEAYGREDIDHLIDIAKFDGELRRCLLFAHSSQKRFYAQDVEIRTTADKEVWKYISDKVPVLCDLSRYLLCGANIRERMLRDAQYQLKNLPKLGTESIGYRKVLERIQANENRQSDE